MAPASLVCTVAFDLPTLMVIVAGPACWGFNGAEDEDEDDVAEGAAAGAAEDEADEKADEDCWPGGANWIWEAEGDWAVSCCCSCGCGCCWMGTVFWLDTFWDTAEMEGFEVFVEMLPLCKLGVLSFNNSSTICSSASSSGVVFFFAFAFLLVFEDFVVLSPVSFLPENFRPRDPWCVLWPTFSSPLSSSLFSSSSSSLLLSFWTYLSNITLLISSATLSLPAVRKRRVIFMSQWPHYVASQKVKKNLQNSDYLVRLNSIFQTLFLGPRPVRKWNPSSLTEIIWETYVPSTMSLFSFSFSFCFCLSLPLRYVSSLNILFSKSSAVL